MATKKKTAKKSATTKKVAKTKPKKSCGCKTKVKASVPPPVKPPKSLYETLSGRQVDPSAKVRDYLVIDDSGTGYRVVLRGKGLELDEANDVAEGLLATFDFRIKEVNGLQALIATIFGATLHDLDDDYEI